MQSYVQVAINQRHRRFSTRCTTLMKSSRRSPPPLKARRLPWPVAPPTPRPGAVCRPRCACRVQSLAFHSAERRAGQQQSRRREHGPKPGAGQRLRPGSWAYREQQLTRDSLKFSAALSPAPAVRRTETRAVARLPGDTIVRCSLLNITRDRSYYPSQGR